MINADSTPIFDESLRLISLLNTCTLHGVNPQEWLVDVLKRIDTMAEEEMYTLLPQHWKAAQDTTLPQAA